MWQRGYGCPTCPTKDIITTTCTDGRKFRSDSVKQPPPPATAAHGTGAVHAGTSGSSDVSNRTIFKQQQALSKRKKQQPGRRHQSVAMIVNHNPYCQCKKCLGLYNQKQITRAYRTNYRCEECSIEKGTDVWLCNTVKNVGGKQKKIECDIKYHAEKEIDFIVTATESSVVSNLTEE
jgi:hypothetical protein